jgi:DNA modification methylase
LGLKCKNYQPNIHAKINGATMVASHQTKRSCLMMEFEPHYCQVIVTRMLKLDPTLSIKRNGIDETQKWLDEQV